MSRAGRSSCRAVLRNRTPAALAAKFFETYKTKVKMILDIRKMRIVVVGANPWWCVSNLYRRLTTHRTGHTSVPGSTSWCLFLRRASPWRRRRRSLCPFVYERILKVITAAHGLRYVVFWLQTYGALVVAKHQRATSFVTHPSVPPHLVAPAEGRRLLDGQ